MEKVVEEIKKFSQEREWDQFHEPVNLAKSIVIEAAELLECFQWNDVKFDKDNVIDELADVMNYCVLLALKLDVNIDDIILAKIQKNKIKYPVEKAKGNYIKYNKLGGE